MVIRLVRDYVARTRLAYSLSFVLLTFTWTLAAAGSLATPSMALALALLVASVIGPAFALAGLALREVHLLPVSRRELWLATWIVAVLVPVLVVSASHAVGLTFAALGARPPALSPASTTFTAVVVLAWCGAEVSLLPLVRGVSERLGAGRVASTLVGLLATIGFAAGPLLPLLAYRTLPVEWGSLTIAWAAGLAACLAAAVLALLHHPPIAPRERPAATVARAATRSIWSPGDRLTGRARLLVQTAWQSGLSWAGAVAGIALAVALFDPFISGSDDLHTALREFGLLPFSPDDTRRSVFVGFLFVTALARSGNALRPSLKAIVRQLRVLPMSTSETASLVLARTGIDWVAIWMALLALQVTVAGWPETLLLQWLLLLIGVDTLIAAVQMRWERSGGILGAGVFVSVLVAGILVRVAGPVAPWLVGAIGLTLIAVAWRLIAGALRHSRVPYGIERPKDWPAPFGVAS